jgi:hypothetical protein
METKEFAVKAIKEFEKKADAKDYTTVITFENGDTGYFHHIEPTQTYFKVGSVVKYEIEEHEKKDKSCKYYVIYMPGGKEAEKPKNYRLTPYTANVKTPKQIKIESRTMTLRYAVDLMISKTIESKQLEETFIRLNNMLDASIDKLE